MYGNSGGVGPRTERLFHKYWEGHARVARLERYYCAPFKGYRGVMQGEPLSSTIFNMVVDAVIRHWATLVSG